MNHEYQLGSYVPEVTMEDEEDEIEERKQVEFADAGPKTFVSTLGRCIAL